VILLVKEFMIALIDNFNQVSLHDPPPEISLIYKNVPEINEVDNRGFPMCRPLFSHSSLPQEFKMKLVERKKFDFKSEFSYFVHVHHNQKLWAKHIDLIPKQILDEVKAGRGWLIFDNTLEGHRIDGDELLVPLYRSINKLQLPHNKIVFITNDLEAEDIHRELKIPDKIKIISFMWNVHDVKRLIKHKCLKRKIDIKTELDYKEKHIKKIKPFLKVNRTNREERDLFMLFIEHENLYKKFKISFPQFTEEVYNPAFKKYTSTKNIKGLLSKMPFDIDKTDTLNRGEPGYGEGKFNADLPFQPIHYKNTFVSVVMCAFPHTENCCHLHSSTFNPIYSGHPIIQFGPYKSLRRMRKLGFKTFNKWWDESYDSEPDAWKRLQMVMDVVLKLSKLNNDEWIKMLWDMVEILQHNSDLIANYNINDNLKTRIYNE
tara:strand:+ start:460 stop:1752 length:1293 start_codon:yes stop_codon:yes gene_type:complete